MTNPQVLSNERMSEVLSTAYGSPEWTMDDVRAARAIESATLDAVGGQEPVSYAADAIYAAWKGCGLDIIRGTDWKRFIGMVPKLYLHPSPTQPPAQAERSPLDELDTLDQKTERNCRVQARYDELMRAGKHGHYETMFRVVREEVEADRSKRASLQSPPPAALKGQP